MWCIQGHNTITCYTLNARTYKFLDKILIQTLNYQTNSKLFLIDHYTLQTLIKTLQLKPKQFFGKEIVSGLKLAISQPKSLRFQPHLMVILEDKPLLYKEQLVKPAVVFTTNENFKPLASYFYGNQFGVPMLLAHSSYKILNNNTDEYNSLVLSTMQAHGRIQLLKDHHGLLLQQTPGQAYSYLYSPCCHVKQLYIKTCYEAVNRDYQNDLTNLTTNRQSLVQGAKIDILTLQKQQELIVTTLREHSPNFNKVTKLTEPKIPTSNEPDGNLNDLM